MADGKATYQKDLPTIEFLAARWKDFDRHYGEWAKSVNPAVGPGGRMDIYPAISGPTPDGLMRAHNVMPGFLDYLTARDFPFEIVKE